MIDGGHLRVMLKLSKKPPKGTGFADYISQVGKQCRTSGEEILRILYYDCPLFKGEKRLPISKKKKTFDKETTWLKDLGKKDLFAIRCGTLNFRGWAIKKDYQPNGPLKDEDFEPQFQQKGVDMRIGLDMAIFSESKSVEMIALMTNDTDFIPTMKHARRAGIQVALIGLPKCKVASELLMHADFYRPISWP